ncbi:hypothetical protein, partial [Enterobacter cloacae complex sp. P12RS]|uniref:hypothetical protein n=1 Tax=Enterobacter cloacae complex sp. P12RS TaxID=2779582 RepID=UPI001D017787
FLYFISTNRYQHLFLISDDFHTLILLNTLPIFTSETISSFYLIPVKTFAPICGTGCNFALFRGAHFI